MNHLIVQQSNTTLATIPYSSEGLLSSLPSPPEGRTGWPWTEESPPLPATLPDGRPWPKISIVTPSYNQGSFIEETIRSILLQNYPNLEYIVIDGGSKDQSVDVINKYEKWLTYWVSEKDKGQAQAINKGIKVSSGDIFNWINSDDLLLPGSLYKVAEAYSKTDDENIIYGHCINFFNLEGTVRNEELYRVSEYSLEAFCFFWKNTSLVWHQTGAFLPLNKLKRIGGLNEDYHFCFDHDLMCRLLTNCGAEHINQSLAKARLHDMSKTVSQSPLFAEERFRACETYAKVNPCVYAQFLQKRSTAFACRDIGLLINKCSGNKLNIFYNLLGLIYKNPQYLITRPIWGAFRNVIFSSL